MMTQRLYTALTAAALLVQSVVVPALAHAGAAADDYVVTGNGRGKDHGDKHKDKQKDQKEPWDRKIEKVKWKHGQVKGEERYFGDGPDGRLVIKVKNNKIRFEGRTPDGVFVRVEYHRDYAPFWLLRVLLVARLAVGILS